MSEMRVSDPSKLHLKRELTQIGKAARALRDPGTTSSWKSPLSSSRSIAPVSGRWSLVSGGGKLVNGKGNRLDSSQVGVFLCNWKAQQPRNAAAADNKETDGGGGGESSTSATEGSLDGSLCNSSTSGLSRRRDANLAVLRKHGVKRAPGIRRRSKKFNPRLSILLNYPGNKKDTILGRKIRGSVNSNAFLNGNGNCRHNPSMALSIDYSAEQSDETGDFSNSEGVSKCRDKKWSLSSKLLSTSRKEDSSYTYSTPALSTSSFYRYRNQNPSTLASWDGDEEIDDPLDMVRGQGCGIPCYWAKRTPKHRGNCSSSCCSPSLSDTFRGKGSSILCGSQSIYSRQHQSVSAFKKQRLSRKSSQGVLPLLRNSRDDCDDELSTDFRELDLEALSRLDGTRWSKCNSRDGSEIPASNGEGVDSTPESSGSLSKKHKPVFFDELIGQNIVVQSLVNAISRGKIAPIYLFQGPRGTGKTSTARIFSAALNCLTTDETSTRPCGYCKECTDFVSGKSKDLLEVDGANKKGIDKVRFLLKKLSNHPPLSSALSRYKIFIIDECHLLPSKIWLEFLKFVEEPPRGVVFIFITTDVDSVPRTIQSRCQKYLFNKIKDTDIVSRLRKIIMDENLDAELDALDLIALSADGSLRDAETMLEQLSLLGKRITTSLVNELIGVVSDEKLLDLLGLAMSSDTAETVKRARELMDTGVDPLLLMSQLAGLIMDIIAGTYKVFGGQTLSEAELEKLKHALKLLSDAEKQLRVSSDRPTWFTATLLQLGRVASPEISQSSVSRRQSSRTTEEASLALETNGNPSHERNGPSEIGDFVSKMKALNGENFSSSASDASGDTSRNSGFKFLNFEKLNDIWEQCIERCHSKTLRQLLHANTKLVSITEAEGILVAYIAFADKDVKTRAESFISSITNSTESFLRRNVEVRMLLLPDGVILPALSKCETTRRDKKDPREEYRKMVVEQIDATNEEIHVQRIESIPGSLNRMKPEKNQVLPQDGTDDQNKLVDELNQELKSLNIADGRFLQKDHASKNHCPVSPSLLHDKSFIESLNKENLVYESATGNEGGCGSIFCWNSSRPRRREKNNKAAVRSRRNGKLSLLGRCLRPKAESRLRR